ncbi:hypothetical protein [Frisingicoccus sp.]|uniref:hypothetical protein n=1 Tax=Frisingicoccus sp. TaxID=1918627 RepID=UPI003AB42F5A
MSDEQILRIVQILYYLIIIVVLLAAIYPVKTYFRPSQNTGNVIAEIQLPKEKRIKNCIMGFIAMMLDLYFLPEQPIFIFSHLIINILILRLVIFSFLPEKICENGIMTRNGFLKWNMIKKCVPCEDNDKALELILKNQRMNGTNRYTLYHSTSMSHITQLINDHLTN